MEKYSSAVSAMRSQSKKKKAHPMERYIGRHAVRLGVPLEIVGYATRADGSYRLIVDASKIGGWKNLRPGDVVFKECEMYLFVGMSISTI